MAQSGSISMKAALKGFIGAGSKKTNSGKNSKKGSRKNSSDRDELSSTGMKSTGGIKSVAKVKMKVTRGSKNHKKNEMDDIARAEFFLQNREKIKEVANTAYDRESA